MNQVEEDKKVEYLEDYTSVIIGRSHQEILEHYISYINRLLPKDIRDKIKEGTHKVVVKSTSLGSSVLDVHPHNRSELVQYVINNEDNIYVTTICSFKYYSMTNCCGALNFSSTIVSCPGRGIGSLLQYLKQDLCYYNSVGYSSCCDKFLETNNHVLTIYGGYKVIDSFINPKSLNEVRIYGKTLDKNKDIRKFKIKIRN